MNAKLLKKLQTAQGMVEFALVLPILLLLILGIFAFGHLFYVYSSVVSASREAARWGAAVGEAPSAFPRYMDCDAIRASAVRLGKFAGVNASDIDNTDDTDTGIEVSYDHGPDADGASVPYASCVAGGEGPAEVVMGDRIVVRVKIDYRPIVPLINMPSFPLEATTFRTILRNVPVGEAPTAVDPCISDTEIFLDTNNSIVGQPAVHRVQVHAIMNQVDYPPTGFVWMYDDGDPYLCEGDLQPEDADTSYLDCEEAGNTPLPAYDQIGDRVIHVAYESDDTCFNNSSTGDPDPDPVHHVDPSPTRLEVTASPSSLRLNDPVRVTVRVFSVTPGGGAPTGYVNITVPSIPLSFPNVPLDPETANNSVANLPPFVATGVGTYPIIVEYPEDADVNYLPSSGQANITVIAPTPTPTPTPTPRPDCPVVASNINFNTQLDGFLLGIRNPDTRFATSLTSIRLNWPELPTAKLQEIHFASSTSSSCTGGSTDCLWTGVVNPPSATVTDGDNKWVSGLAQLAVGQTKEMRMVFNHDLPNGPFQLTVNFSNGCALSVSGDRLIVNP